MIKYYEMFFKLSLIVFIIACINTFTHATAVDGKPSANERTQRISNGGFEYSYRHGQLDTGKNILGMGLVMHIILILNLEIITCKNSM